MSTSSSALGDDHFIVEKILDKRIKNNKIEYLIKWKNYPKHQSTWEPIENLDGSKKLLKEFE